MEPQFRTQIARIWIQAARPKTLLASLAPIQLGLAIASSEVPIQWPLAGLTLLSALSLQVGTNFVNDLVDHLNGSDTKARVGPLRAMQSGLISVRQMQLGIILVYGICVAAGLFLTLQSGNLILIIGVLGIAMGVVYTLGTSVLSLYGLSDFMVIIFFGSLAVAGTVYIQTGDVQPSALVAGIAPGLLSTAILTVNNVRDIVQDTRAGRRTWVVRFGLRFGRWEYLLCLVGAALIPLSLYLLGGAGLPSLSATAIMILSIPLVRQIWTWQGKLLNRTLGFTAGLLMLHSVAFSLGWLM